MASGLFMPTKEYSSFMRVIEQGDGGLVRLGYILDAQAINIREMTNEMQLHMWSSIKSKLTAEWLLDYIDKAGEKFNLRIQDEQGNTPLMMLSKKLSPDEIEQIRPLESRGEGSAIEG